MDLGPLRPHRNIEKTSSLPRLELRESVSDRTLPADAAGCCLPLGQQGPIAFSTNPNANNHRRLYTFSIAAVAVACVSDEKVQTPENRGVPSRVCLAIEIVLAGSIE
jgi:hypothetical protein